MRIKMNVTSIKQTQALAKAFSDVLKPPMVIVLSGDLGSGKTTFVKCVAECLGCTELVTSPTFTLLNTYSSKFPIYHFDMYRLSSAQEAFDCGFAEYFDKSRLHGICFVEWAENVEGLIKDVDFFVKITKKGESRREFVVEEVKK